MHILLMELHVWVLPSIDKDYEAHEMTWNPKGKAVALVGKTSVICCRIGSEIRK